MEGVSVIVDSRDDPEAPSQADLSVALDQLRELEGRVRECETRMNSIPVRVRAPGGWFLAGRQSAVLTLASLLLVGFVAWLVYRWFLLTRA
jgi:hypothetical protein